MRLIPAAIGIITGMVAVAVSAVLALIVGMGNPIIGVGSAVIDAVPAGVKTAVIDLFGTNDKVFLLVVLGIVIAALAALAGILQVRRPPGGIIVLLGVGLVGVIATGTRANATALAAVPTIAGVAVGILVLRMLVARFERLLRSDAARDRALARRSFLRTALVTAAVALLAGTAAQLLATKAAVTTELRARLKLPAPASRAPAVPASAELHVDGISPWVVPNKDFYRIDTALQVPSVDPDSWRLRITGLVEHEIELTFAELLALPLIERYVTLACVSQEVGGNLIGNAKWLGYPIRPLLERARPRAGTDMVLSTSVDGFTASTPLSVLQDPGTDAMLAVGMNGVPLPLEHGFPVRMVVPGLYGYVSATKWLTELKLTTFAKDQGYWTPRGWSALGPVKLSSRIDTPIDGAGLHPGPVAIAGVAWRQHTGIARVQVQIDNGAWRDARLATTVTTDAWLQWSLAWTATRGQHTIAVRAVDETGAVQTAVLTDPAPNGSTGLHTIGVQVG